MQLQFFGAMHVQLGLKNEIARFFILSNLIFLNGT